MKNRKVRKEKRITIAKVKELIHMAYDRYEVLTLQALEETIPNFAEHKQDFLLRFGELVVEHIEKIEKEMRK